MRISDWSSDVCSSDLVNFLSVHRDLFRGVDANTHLVSFDAEHGHGDFTIANNQALCAPTSQNQHTFLLTQFSSGTTVCKKKALDLQPKRSQIGRANV